MDMSIMKTTPGHVEHGAGREERGRFTITTMTRNPITMIKNRRRQLMK
jgi:hypothetical protein